MVNTIDQDARRREIVEAVWRVLERGGLEAASVRAVAAEAGLSTGSLRHFFTSQAQLHEFALLSLSDRVSERMRSAASIPDIRERCLAMLSELMPLRDDTARELGIWWEFVHRSRHDADLAAIVGRQAIEMRGFIRDAAVGMSELGFHPSGADIDQAAATLNAIVDGLTFELLTAPALMTREQAGVVLRLHLFGASAPIPMEA